MLLHMPNCLLCEEENQFYDPTIIIDGSIQDQIFADIIGLETEDSSNIENLQKSLSQNNDLSHSKTVPVAAAKTQ